MTAIATFYEIAHTNDMGWRMEMPAKAIGAKTCPIPKAEFKRALTEPNTDTAFKWTQTADGRTSYPAHEGTAVWLRPCLVRATHAKAMRELHGIRTVAEIDDNYLGNPRHNVSLRADGWNAVSMEDHVKAQASNDAVIFSTAWLRDFYVKRMRGYFKKWRIPVKQMPPLYVCRNHVDFDVFPPPKEPTDNTRLRIGYMGSDSHVWDIKLAYPALKWAHDNGHQVVIIGHDPKWRTKMDYEYIPWIEPKDFRRALLPLDIGVCPLVVNHHTMGKSDIKVLEYAMSGAASVAQNCVVYNRTLTHEQHCLLAGSRDEMGWAVMRLCRDAKLRRELVLNTQAYIREERDIAKNVGEWREAVTG